MLASIRAELSALDAAKETVEEEAMSVSQAVIGSDISAAVDVSDFVDAPASPSKHPPPFSTFGLRQSDIRAMTLRHEAEADHVSELPFKPRTNNKARPHPREVPVEELLHGQWHNTMQKRENDLAVKQAKEAQLLKESSVFRPSRRTAALARRHAERTGQTPSQRLWNPPRRPWLDSTEAIDWERGPATPAPPNDPVRALARSGGAAFAIVSGGVETGSRSGEMTPSSTATPPNSVAAWRRAHSARGPVRVAERNANWAQARQHKLATLASDHNRRASAECTFRPAVSSTYDRSGGLVPSSSVGGALSVAARSARWQQEKEVRRQAAEETQRRRERERPSTLIVRHAPDYGGEDEDEAEPHFMAPTASARERAHGSACMLSGAFAIGGHDARFAEAISGAVAVEDLPPPPEWAAPRR